MSEHHDITFTLNGKPVSATVEARLHLADFLRHTLRLTGTHVGCEHGFCGACSVMIDGRSARSCLMLAVQADGANVETIEGLTERNAIAVGLGRRVPCPDHYSVVYRSVGTTRRDRAIENLSRGARLQFVVGRSGQGFRQRVSATNRL